MRFDQYRYLWPPRPETKIPTDLIGFYEKLGWVSQVKKNGTCTVIFSHGDDVTFKTRHDEDHKAWAPNAVHRATFSGRPQWNVYVAELLHSRGVGIKDHLYLFDILVSDGQDLSGRTFQDRQLILADRFSSGDSPRIDAGLGAIYVNEHVSRARLFTADFDQLWNRLGEHDEGLVFKNPVAALRPCVTAKANAGWQVKSRKPSAHSSF